MRRLTSGRCDDSAGGFGGARQGGSHGIHPPRPFRPLRQPPVPRHHELRPAHHRGRLARDHGLRPRAGHQLLRHRQRLRQDKGKGATESRSSAAGSPGWRAPRAHGARDQAVRRHGRLAQRGQAVRAEHPTGARRQPEAAPDRLHRPVPVPPRRPRYAVGGDLAGDRGRGRSGQDPLRRQQQLRGLAHRPGPGCRRRAALHRPRERAVDLQPGHPRHRAGGHPRRRALRPGHPPVVAAPGRAAGRRTQEGPRGQAPAERPRSHHGRAEPASRSRPTRTSPTSSATSRATSPWPGCCTSRPSPRRSSARARRSSSTQPSAPSTSTWTTRRSRDWTRSSRVTGRPPSTTPGDRRTGCGRSQQRCWAPLVLASWRRRSNERRSRTTSPGWLRRPLLDVAVVGGLAGDLAQVPAHAAAGSHHGRRGRHGLSSGSWRSPAALAAMAYFSSLVAMSPAGATSFDRTYGASVVVTVSGDRSDRMHTRVASAMTMITRIAKNAARMPSIVVLVTTCCMSSRLVAGGSTSPASRASEKSDRCSKKPILGSSENTF